MLLDAIIIVLRETLEAGVLISLLLSVATDLRFAGYWIFLSLGLGAGGAALYSGNAQVMAGWFDDVGLEVINALLQYSIYLCLLLLICSLLSRRQYSRPIMWLMTLVVTMAVTREGAEVMIFFSGFIARVDTLIKPLTSGFVGLMIGMSVGAICYYVMLSLRPAVAVTIRLVLLTLIGGGMVMQATQLLIQADWLPAAMPVWDSSPLLPEQSVVGTVAYAVFGYEAAPTRLEMIAYVSSILLIPLLALAIRIYPVIGRYWRQHLGEHRQ